MSSQHPLRSGFNPADCQRNRDLKPRVLDAEIHGLRLPGEPPAYVCASIGCCVLFRPTVQGPTGSGSIEPAGMTAVSVPLAYS